MALSEQSFFASNSSVHYDLVNPFGLNMTVPPVRNPSTALLYRGTIAILEWGVRHNSVMPSVAILSPSVLHWFLHRAYVLI
ncbi:MAG: hypothetical protein JRJ14_04190 [Deltaproteobacteria bacterium]|nr:hypothetical protein [Deltaproteobacteria bacterium]